MMNPSADKISRYITKKMFYTVGEVAEMLDVSRKSIYKQIAEGCYKTIKVGSTIRISKNSFDEWLDNQLNKSKE